jgi:hypothetical protein
MGNTPNNNFPYPEATGLVKDGWEDIKDLATSIDTKLGVYGAAGLVKLNTTSFSAVSSASINDVFSATYDRYRIMVYTTPTANIGIDLKFRVGGADNTSANYRFGVHYTDGANGTTYLYSQVGATAGNICQGFADPLAYAIDIHNPFGAFKTIWHGTYFMHRTASTFFQTGYTGGSFNDTTSFTGFTIGGGTQTGTVSVYGYSK